MLNRAAARQTRAAQSKLPWLRTGPAAEGGGAAVLLVVVPPALCCGAALGAAAGLAAGCWGCWGAGDGANVGTPPGCCSSVGVSAGDSAGDAGWSGDEAGDGEGAGDDGLGEGEGDAGLMSASGSAGGEGDGSAVGSHTAAGGLRQGCQGVRGRVGSAKRDLCNYRPRPARRHTRVSPNAELPRTSPLARHLVAAKVALEARPTRFGVLLQQLFFVVGSSGGEEGGNINTVLAITQLRFNSSSPTACIRSTAPLVWCLSGTRCSLPSH